MRKEVLCILGVLLASAWAQAQHGPSVSASPASAGGGAANGPVMLPTTANDLWNAANAAYANGGYYDPAYYAPQFYPGYENYGYTPPNNLPAQLPMANTPPAMTPSAMTPSAMTPSAMTPGNSSRSNIRQVQSNVMPGIPLEGAPMAGVPLGEFPVGPVGPIGADPVVEGGAVSSRMAASGTARNDRVWFSIEYLLASLERGRLSTPLVTIGSANDVRPGALDQPGTAVVFNERNLSFGTRDGIRASAGVFLDSERFLSIDGSFFILFPETRSSVFAADAQGNPIIARPIFSTQANGLRTLLTSTPGQFTGTTRVDVRSQLYGFEANGAANTRLMNGIDADLLGGFRYVRLEDRLTISDQVFPLQDNVLNFLGAANFVNAPNFITDRDDFVTSNTFYGVNLGARFRCTYDWLSLNAYGKVALGINDERVRINGTSTLVTPGGNTTAAGGVLALPSNIGNYRRSVFAVIPEAGVNLGVEPIRHVRLMAGYSFLYWNAVARPGALIDPNINPGQIPTSTQFGTSNSGGSPQFRFVDQSLRVHTLNLGVELYF